MVEEIVYTSRDLEGRGLKGSPFQIPGSSLVNEIIYV